MSESKDKTKRKGGEPASCTYAVFLLTNHSFRGNIKNNLSIIGNQSEEFEKTGGNFYEAH
jgi:hypothetical protein